MKKNLQRFLLATIAIILIIPFITPIKVNAEGTVDTISVYSSTRLVGVGELPEFDISVHSYLSPNITVDPYGSNTNWSKWESGMSSWHGFGTDTPTAVKGETHYAMRLKVNLEAGYTFADEVTIILNGEEVTDEGHTLLDKEGFDWGGYLYIDLGTARDIHTLSFVTNGGTAVEEQTIVDGDYFIPDMAETTKEGYNFGGWFTDEALTKKYESDFGAPDPITKDTTFYAKWIDKNEATITSVNVTIKSPQIGTTVKWEEIEDENGAGMLPNLTPTVILGNGTHIFQGGSYYIMALPSMNPDGYDEPFEGTFEAGKDYYAEIYLVPEEGYEFADNVALTVNDGKDYELSEWNYKRQLMFYVKLSAGTENPKVIKGENQTYSLNSTEKLMFEFDIDYDEFKENGKVYMDGNLVDSKNYTLTKGSTIVTFNTEYTKTLSSGTHTLKVATNNQEVSTNFSITSNPKTGDNIIIYIITSLASIIGLSIITIYKKKKINI